MADENPSAFPCSPGDVPYWNEGMSLRDWFAGQALPAATVRAHSHGMSTIQPGSPMHFDKAAQVAYSYADAMLAARKDPK